MPRKPDRFVGSKGRFSRVYQDPLSLDVLMPKVEKITESGCWIWMGYSQTVRGATYGSCWNGSRYIRSHRAVYENIKGVVPDGLVLDHLCRVTLCCNPDHLEPVTTRTNILRGVSVTALQAAQTHCKRGHELSGSNLYVNNGCRVCKACRALFTKAYRERNVEKVAKARKDRYDRTGT